VTGDGWFFVFFLREQLWRGHVG